MAPDQYALFAGHCYYPSGGAADYRATGAIDELKRLYAENSKKWSRKIGGYPDAWGQIAALPSLKIVLVATSGGKWKEPDHEP